MSILFMLQWTWLVIFSTYIAAYIEFIPSIYTVIECRLFVENSLV